MDLTEVYCGVFATFTEIREQNLNSSEECNKLDEKKICSRVHKWETNRHDNIHREEWDIYDIDIFVTTP